ncbi:MAG: hypothetical protein VZR02_07770 [Lachnospiraceae bacterium]|nr:hypothetical protein [Lachnospiraceae bacterium]
MKTPKYKRVLAMIAICLILAMYISTFIFALMKSSFAKSMFRASLACTIIVPVFLYVALMVARLVRPKKSAVVDGVIVSSSLTAGEGIDFLLADLRKNGLMLFTYKADENASLQDYLTELAETNSFKKSRYIYIDSSRENVHLAQSLGFAGIDCKDPVSCRQALRSLDIHV